jgi:hypothetical protein
VISELRRSGEIRPLCCPGDIKTRHRNEREQPPHGGGMQPNGDPGGYVRGSNRRALAGVRGCVASNRLRRILMA